MADTSTLQIKYKDIPIYLQAGAFYRNLDDGDPDGVIDIPTDLFWNDGERVSNPHELSQLLRTTMFWMLDEFPFGVVRFCSQTDITLWNDVVTKFEQKHRRHTDFFSALLSAFGEPNNIKFEKVILTGNWELMVRTAARMDKDSPAATYAASKGNLRLLKHLREEGYSWHEGTCLAACFRGSLECLRYAHENGCPWDYRVYEHSAQSGYLHCMEYAHQEGLEWHEDVCAGAAQMNRLSCLEYAHRCGCPWDARTVERAAYDGYLDCLDFALRNGCPQSEEASFSACHFGIVGSLRLLHKYGPIWTAQTCVRAAGCQDLACLRFLHENGCPWDENTPRYSARVGRLHSLKYALEEGCVYNNSLLLHAATGGNLECLKYLVEDQLLRMDSMIFVFALLKGNLQCVQYLLDQGCPCARQEFNYNSDFASEIFSDHNRKFVLCLELAVERGWQPSWSFIQFLDKKGIKHCEGMIEKEYWFAHVNRFSTDDRVVKKASEQVKSLPSKQGWRGALGILLLFALIMLVVFWKGESHS